MYALFPFHLIDKGERVILYGGGLAGKNLLSQIWETDYCDVVAVCDRHCRELNIRDVPLISIEEINDFEYDRIVITPIDRKIRREIRAELVENGIDEAKIISDGSEINDWNNPRVGFLNQRDEYEAKKNLQDYLLEMDPAMLVSSRRIDIIVRFLLFRDFMSGVENKAHLSLYSRYVFSRTGGYEPSRYYSDEGKDSVAEFIERGKALCESIKKEGFRPYKFIPVEQGNRPCDGLHRIAAALAAGEKIWIHQYENAAALDCDMEWFESNGFSVDDRIRILRGFCDVYAGQTAMLVLYAPVKELWDYIERQADSIFHVAGGLTLDFSDYYIAFDNYIRQIYSDFTRANEFLLRKYELLSLAPLQFRILVLTDEKKDKEDFYYAVHCFKKRMRESLHYEIDSNVPIQIHSSDSREEFEHLKRLFLSANNVNWEKRRTTMHHRAFFYASLDRVKRWCREQGIHQNDVCVVGSAVLELFGLRDAKNINIVLAEDANLQQGTDDGTIEIMRNGYFADECGNPISNDIVITQDEYHTIFADIKFCNLEFVYRYKRKRMQEKDRYDIAKIEQFFKYATNREDKEYLHQQVRVELMKRGINVHE